MSRETDRRFGPTTDVVPGWIGLVMVLALAAWTALMGPSLTAVKIIIGCLLFAMLIWCLMLRPRVILAADLVVLRNMLRDVRIPLVLVEDIQVRQVTRVRVGRSQYVGLGVGRTRRSMVRGNRPGGQPGAPPGPRATHLTSSLLPDFVEEQVLAAARDARDRGVAAGPVIWTWASWEPFVLGLLALALVATFVR